MEKLVENLPKTPNYIQILSNSCSNLQEIPRKPPLDTPLYINHHMIGDLIHIFSLNYVVGLGNWIYVLMQTSTIILASI